MQNNQNLWIGLLIGSGLTGLLIYVLSQQANLFDATPPITKTTTPVIAPFVKPEPPVTTKTKTAEPQRIDLPGLPENPRLTEKELAKLSPEEREKYEKVLATYQQVRDKVLNLHQEQEQLEQQMNRIIEENTTIDRQLDKMQEDQQAK